jgi:hypothetical protein
VEKIPFQGDFLLLYCFQFVAKPRYRFGEAQRRSGVPSNAPPLSKYALQLLYALRNGTAMTYGQIVTLMDRRPGTGRYTCKKGEWRPKLGSAASSSQIRENRVTAGLLDELPVESTRPLAPHKSAPTMLMLSARGHELLRLLLPDCEDPDLPFRLDAWCSEGAGAKAAMGRDIKTFLESSSASTPPNTFRQGGSNVGNAIASKTKTTTQAAGQVGNNGAIIHVVLVATGPYKGRRVTFTQHSPDRYTVFGVRSDPNCGMSIERRRQGEQEVLMHNSGAMLRLSEDVEWIAHCYQHKSYYGVLAVGKTPQEAYEKTFNQFTS